jgi:hypothetical protein
VNDDAKQTMVGSRIGVDVAILVTALPLAVFTLGFGLYLLVDPERMQSGFPTDQVPEGWPPLFTPAVLFALCAAWLGVKGMAALFRALERGPLIIADETGVTFHRTFLRRSVPWSDVRWIRVTGWGRPYYLTFGLRRWIWSVEYPWGGQRICFAALHLGNDDFISHELVSRLQALREDALGPAPVSVNPMSPGPDAAAT